jgi:hypothetical protein
MGMGIFLLKLNGPFLEPLLIILIENFEYHTPVRHVYQENTDVNGFQSQGLSLTKTNE